MRCEQNFRFNWSDYEKYVGPPAQTGDTSLFIIDNYTNKFFLNVGNYDFPEYLCGFNSEAETTMNGETPHENSGADDYILVFTPASIVRGT